MGSFAGFLGDAASGYAQAAHQDTQRKFQAEMDRRTQMVNLLGQLASNPTTHPETQQNALQMALETIHAPVNLDKPVKPPDFSRLITRGPQQPTQTATTPGPTAGPQHDLTNLIPPGQPMPTPPTSAGAPMPQVPQQAQFTPPPNMGMRYTPTELAGIERQQAEAIAGGQLGGQIGARQKALEGMELEPTQRAMMTLGVPGIAGLMGAYGKGDEMPAQAALAAGYPLPAGVDPNDPNTWVRLQRNKVGGIVGSFAIPVPPEYAPTTKQGFTYQWNGSQMVAVPVTTTSQKQMPTPPGQTAAPAGAKVEPEKGKAVGKMKPPQALMIVPPTEPGGAAHAIAARPGSAIPTGAVTAGGLSSANVPTSTIRTMAGRSIAQLPIVQQTENEITRLDKAGKLGPLMGRWNNFLLGKVGSADPDYAYLKGKTEMLKSAIQLIHTGARGSPPILAKFDGMLDAGKMDAPTLKAGLRVMREQLETYSKEGMPPGFERGTAPPTPPGAAGAGTDFFSRFGGTPR